MSNRIELKSWRPIQLKNQNKLTHTKNYGDAADEVERSVGEDAAAVCREADEAAREVVEMIRIEGEEAACRSNF